VKLSKRKINADGKAVAFYRDLFHGKLYLVSEKHDYTRETVDKMDFERSWRGRILKDAEKKFNPFYSIVDGLVKSDRNVTININFSNGNKSSDVGMLIRDNLTWFGRRLKAPDSEYTLEALICKILAGENQDEIRANLEKLKNIIQESIERQKDGLCKSIQNNRIPFSLNGDKIEASSKKMKWLYSFLDGKIDEHMLDDYWVIYKYNELENKINQNVDGIKNKDARSISKAVSKAVHEHHHQIRIRGINNDQLLFLKAVEQHFKKYYPVKSKHSSNVYDEKLKQEKNYKFYYSENFVKGEVRRSIVNQLVSGLIQQGKLLHYFYDETQGWQKDYLNSYGLSYIQVEEAFKKSLMDSISWAINRLYYFVYDPDDSENEINDNIVTLYRDIISALGNITIDENGNLYDKINNPITCETKNGPQIVKLMSRIYYHEVKDEKGNNFYPEQDKFSKKVAQYFPIRDKDSFNTIARLFYEAKESIAHLRHQNFHYRKNSLIDILASSKGSWNKSKLMLVRDIYYIHNYFREHIRSTGILDYYPVEFLKECIEACGLNFNLYAPNNSLWPSFSKVYKKGSNLYKSEKDHKGLKWYIEVTNNDAGSLAYKNFLQLIYYHSFLPALTQNQSLITNFINSTKKWNREEAGKAAQRRNNDKSKNSDSSVKAYRYEAMPDYKGEPLADYFKALQKEQIAQANKVQEGEAEKNNYILFIQDVFVRAFDDYLSRLEIYREKLQSPTKQDINVNDALEMLVPKARRKSSIRMKCSFEGTHNIEDNILCFYPFLRLLDAKELSTLQHQFVRYRCSLNERTLPESQETMKEELIKFLIKLEELIELVRFTIPATRSDKVESVYKTMFEVHFSDFLDKDVLKNQECSRLYLQSNGKTAIPRKHMMLLARSAPMPLYRKMFKDYYRITEAECLEYIKLGQTIEQDINKLTELHKELEKARLKFNLEDNHNGKSDPNYDKLVQKVKDYAEKLQCVVRYKHLRRKLTFESLYKLFSIHVDLHGVMLAFVQNWERDMFFLLTALKYMGYVKGKSDDCVDRIFAKGKVIHNLLNSKKYLRDDDKNLLASLCWNESSKSNIKENKIKVRNVISHLNHFTQSSNNKQPSIEEMINNLRYLLYYDRKRQNAVTKSIKDLMLKEHNIKISWKNATNAQGNVELKTKRVEDATIEHLKHICKGKSCNSNKVPCPINQNDKANSCGLLEQSNSTELLRCLDRLITFEYTSANP